MFYKSHSVNDSSVLFIYRLSTVSNPYSYHAGLGINSLHSVKVLRKQGIHADLAPVSQANEIPALLARYSSTPTSTPTHCVIQAPWITSQTFSKIINDFPQIHFIVRCHSQVGFLQVEPTAVKILRDLLVMQDNAINLTLSANSERLAGFLRRVYSGRCLYLPNLYDIPDVGLPAWKSHTVKDVVKLASFGSLRLLKNHMTSAAAALLIGQILNCSIEFYVNVNREEHGKGVLQSLRNLFSGLRSAMLVEDPWEAWPEFRRTISTMDLCFQLSMTETFNLVTADAAASYVPSVVSDAIEWVPDAWKVSPDDAEAAARLGVWLLSDREAGSMGRAALEGYARRALGVWIEYLGSNPT